MYFFTLLIRGQRASLNKKAGHLQEPRFPGRMSGVRLLEAALNFGPAVLSGLVAPDQGFCGLDNVFRGEAQFTHHDLAGRRRTEAI